MTCISYRDGVMASDSRMVGDYVGIGTKLYRHHDEIIGFAGDVEQALAFIDWYRDKASRQPEIAHERDWYALVASPRGLVLWGPSLRGMPIIESYYAIGSGAPFAITAMDCGKTAAESIKYAIKRDPYCAGPVITLSLEKRAKKK